MQLGGNKAKLVAALMILMVVGAAVPWLMPRFWVRDRSVNVVYKGHMTTKVTLYHGSAGRHILMLDEPGQLNIAYLYNPIFIQTHQDRDIEVCEREEFISLKVLMLAKHAQPDCSVSKSTIQHLANSISFQTKDGATVKVSWLGFIDPPR